MTRYSEINYTNLRSASLIGKEFSERVINKMIKIALQTKKITVQNSKNILGYLDVEDAVNGLYEFVKNSTPENWKPIYNLGQKYENIISLKDIAQTIKSLFEEINWNIELNINNVEKADKSCLMDSKWFYEDSKWEPTIPIKKTIQKIFQHII